MVIGIALLINNNRRNQPSWLMVSAQKQFLKWYFWAQNEPILLRAEQSVCLQTDIHRPVWLCGERIFLTNILINEKALSCWNQQLSVYLVGVPGLEPGKAGPESAVLPLHHTPILDSTFSKCAAKVVVFSETTKKKRIFLLKTPKFSVFIALFGLFHVSL